jgi:hypothetical protein
VSELAYPEPLPADDLVRFRKWRKRDRPALYAAFSDPEMAAWAFDELRLARLELTTAPDNEGSQRVARRCGFVEEGRLRSHLEFKGGRRDTVVFGALPADLVRAPQ